MEDSVFVRGEEWGSGKPGDRVDRGRSGGVREGVEGKCKSGIGSGNEDGVFGRQFSTCLCFLMELLAIHPSIQFFVSSPTHYHLLSFPLRMLPCSSVWNDVWGIESILFFFLFFFVFFGCGGCGFVE